MYLYILKFKHKNLLKIGISEKEDYSRIIDNSKTLEDPFDLESSVIVKAKRERTIKVLEKQLLDDTFDFIPDEREQKLFVGKDGKTEIRNADCFDDLIEDINYKINKRKDSGLSINIGIKLESVALKKRSPINRINHTNQTTEDFLELNSTLELIKKFIEHQEEINHIRYNVNDNSLLLNCSRIIGEKLFIKLEENGKKTSVLSSGNIIRIKNGKEECLGGINFGPMTRSDIRTKEQNGLDYEFNIIKKTFSRNRFEKEIIEWEIKIKSKLESSKIPCIDFDKWIISV